MDILTVHLPDVCKRFKMEAALRSYLQEKTGNILFVVVVLFCFGLVLHRRFMFIHIQQSGDERKCYIALWAEPNANAVCSVSA